MSKIIYHYSPETGELTGADMARESPLEEGVYLIPANATDVEPPTTGENQAVVFSGGLWSLKPDFRGQTWYDTTTRQPVTVSTIGQPDDVLTKLVPTTSYDKWNGSSWVTDGAAQLADAQAAKIAVLSSACQAAIYAGFTSSALGALHAYPFKASEAHPDQQNLASSVLASTLPNLPADWTTPFWCADAIGNWAFVPHSAAQIQKVGQDAMASKLANIQKNATLAAEVMAATTIEAVQAIAWS